MLVTFEEFKALGYFSVPEAMWQRYEAEGRTLVHSHTFGRVTLETMTEDNKRGICKLAEFYYYEDHPAEDNANKQLSSFTNGSYGEVYVQPKQQSAETVKSREEVAAEIVSRYFTQEQLWRGVV